jgi:hypothetical protein
LLWDFSLTTFILVSVKQLLADRAKGRADHLKNVATTQVRVVELERELKPVRETARRILTDKRRIHLRSASV